MLVLVSAPLWGLPGSPAFAAPVNSVAPSISGTPEYDADADRPARAPGRPRRDVVRLSLVAGRRADPDAVGATYVAGLDDLDHRLSVEVTAGDGTTTATAVSAETEPVARAVLQAKGGQKIVGAARYTHTLVAKAGQLVGEAVPGHLPVVALRRAGRRRDRPALLARSRRLRRPASGRGHGQGAGLRGAHRDDRPDRAGGAPGRRAPHGPLPRGDPRFDHDQPQGVRRAGPGDVRRPPRLAGRRDRVPACGARRLDDAGAQRGEPGPGVLLGVQQHVELPGRALRDHQPGALEARVAGVERCQRRAARLPAHGGQPRVRALPRASATRAAPARDGRRR